MNQPNKLRRQIVFVEKLSLSRAATHNKFLPETILITQHIPSSRAAVCVMMTACQLKPALRQRF